LSSSLSERPTDRIYTKNQTVPFKIEAFPGGSSLAQGRRKELFRGILEYFGSKNRPRSGRLSAADLGRILGTFPSKNPPEREKIEGRRSGKMGTKKGPQRFAASPP
jgi:hypothetical protein